MRDILYRVKRVWGVSKLMCLNKFRCLQKEDLATEFTYPMTTPFPGLVIYTAQRSFDGKFYTSLQFSVGSVLYSFCEAIGITFERPLQFWMLWAHLKVKYRPNARSAISQWIQYDKTHGKPVRITFEIMEHCKMTNSFLQILSWALSHREDLLDWIKWQ